MIFKDIKIKMDNGDEITLPSVIEAEDEEQLIECFWNEDCSNELSTFKYYDYLVIINAKRIVSITCEIKK